MKIENITVNFTNKSVFNKKTIHFEESSINWLQGANGVGKTTLFKVLSGLIDSQSIKVIFDNKDRIDLKNFIDSVTFIPDKPYLFEYLTGKQNIRYLISLFELGRYEDEIYKNLEHFGLNDSLYIMIKNYSLGMKIKLYLSVILEKDAKLFLIDEVLNNIDEKAQQILLEHLIIMTRRGTTVVYTSHVDVFNNNDRRVLL